jgi:hypothetical protein
MPLPSHEQLVDLVRRAHGVLISLSKFDEIEVRPVVKIPKATTPRDVCVTGLYYRTVGNVATILPMKSAQHFQALSMCARAMFELSVDMRLLDVVSDAVDKMLNFWNVERLRSARNIIKFANTNPTAKIHDLPVYQKYEQEDGATIDAKRQALWPDVKKVDHWSGMNLRERVEKLKAPFDQTYHVNYAQLSWQVHAGLVGVTNLAADVFLAACGKAFEIAAEAYIEVLRSVISELHINNDSPKIYAKLRLARMLPFTETKEDALQLEAELLA